MDNYTIADTIIVLHQIAREVETRFGIGELSQQLRNSADKLTYLATNNISPGANNGTN